ncbi:MAG: phenylalanine--tRNA ligase subunit beta [Deltaproteobacteria bacterium]|nr:phenylalanine--tRNA ligase subunit beta [Deltaproteobacteria bacterium]
MAGLEVESLVPLNPDGRGEGDWVVELSVTPNRGDCLGILGLAREVAVLSGGRLKLPPVSAHAADPSVKESVSVQILSSRLCPRYSARVVRGIHVTPSPSWMQARLEACGIRSINNVVDVTNWVMLETGQPLHAFDLERLTSKRIVIRRAGEIKRFVTLDGTERELSSEDLLICDGDVPVALAGVMGGRNSEVQPESRVVLLESAHFEPLAIRRTAKRLGLHSEASHRFERGVDPEGTLYALDRAVFLLQEIASGVPLKGVVDRYARRTKAKPILVRSQKVRELLGVTLSPGEVERLLKSLGLKIQRRSREGLAVIAPSFRPDLTREADMIEELARLHGYHKIPSTLPLVRQGGGKADSRLRWERKIRFFLTGEGLTETIHLPFTSGEMNRRFPGLWEEQRSAVAVLNPLTQENGEMRLSLVPGLVEGLRVHVSQKLKGFYAFDLGKVFSLGSTGSPEERECLAGGIYGLRERKGLRAKEESPWTFLHVKGLVEGMLELIGVTERVVWTGRRVPSILHPGKAAALEIEGSWIGYVGELHPDLCEELAFPSFLIFELDFEGLVQYAAPEFTARSLSRFPSVERDLSIVLDDGFPAQRIISWIKEHFSHSLIEDVHVFDQYKGAPVPQGKKSLAYTISYRAKDRTLTDAEVSALHRELVGKIGEAFGAQLRE